VKKQKTKQKRQRLEAEAEEKEGKRTPPKYALKITPGTERHRIKN
jgi:hypothetical protein